MRREVGWMGADPESVSETAKKRGMNQLGSLGSGNHFLEVQKIDKILDERAAVCYGSKRNRSSDHPHSLRV